MRKDKEEIKRKWYHSNFGIIFLLIFFFPAGLYLMWRYSSWKLKPKLTITGLFLLISFLFSSIANISGKEKLRRKPMSQSVTQVTNTPAITQKTTDNLKEKQKQEEKIVSSLEKIENIVKEKSGGVEATIFSGDDFATKDNAPYNVVINYPFNHSISSCFGAKTVSQEIVKALYSDALTRPDIDRVMVSIPYYLRMSLGAFDGQPMGEKNTFNGPTLFWNTLIDSTGYEDESGGLRGRTWGVLLDRCK